MNRVVSQAAARCKSRTGMALWDVSSQNVPRPTASGAKRISTAMLLVSSVTFGLLLVLLSAWQQLQRWGGLGLIALGVLDSSFIPLPGSMDALTVVLATARKSWWPYYALMATGGSVLGGYLTYRVGKKGGEEALEKKISKDKMQKVHRAFEKGGFTAVFVPALLPPPVPMVPFLLTAGAMKYSTRKFLAALAAGRALRYFLLAFLASLYGRAILGLFAKYHTPMLWILVGVSIVAGLAGLGYWIYRRRASKNQGRAKGKKDVAA